jgi:F0F1-type ATP synthase assembly protein I
MLVTPTPGPVGEPSQEPPQTPAAREAGSPAPSAQPEKPAMTSQNASLGALGLVAVGTVNATSWLAGIFGGWLLDRHFGTVPLFILLGLVVGTVTGAISTYKEVRRYLSS